MRPYVTLAACVALAWASPAAAQSLSSDQIIRSLRPTGMFGMTRGIRPVGPSPDAAAPSATLPLAPHSGTAAVAAPSSTTAASTPRAPAAPRLAPPPSVDLTVQFATGSAELTAEAARTLDELGRALTSDALAGYRFRIEGHTDTVGTPEHNKALSEQRAATVMDYLATKWSVDRAKVEAVGMGQDRLLVSTGPNVAQARNRRVTVVNLGA